MYTFEQLPFELNNYINDFVIEQTARENYKKVVEQINNSYMSICLLLSKQFSYSFQIKYLLYYKNHFKLKPTYLITNNNHYVTNYPSFDLYYEHFDDFLRQHSLIYNK